LSVVLDSYYRERRHLSVIIGLQGIVLSGALNTLNAARTRPFK
jgi:hypothetical protein